MPNCVHVDQLYIFGLIFIFPVATNCPVVALRNNFLDIYNGIMFPSLPVSTLYGTIILTLFDNRF